MGLFSVGFPTGVRGATNASSSNPTNRLPTSLKGQATRPPGGSTAHLQLFKSNTGYSRMQIAKTLDFTRCLRLPENNNGPQITQPKAACGKASDSVGNSSKATPIRLKSSCKFDRNGLLFTSLRSADGPTRREMRLSGRYGREMIPRSVSPFTKNCMASATSSKPMILTRMRMPVSPSTIRIRPAPASTK